MAVGDRIQVPEMCKLNPVTDKDAEIPGALWDPHYTDLRFFDTHGGLTIFVDPEQPLVVGDFVDEKGEGLVYVESDRLALSHGDAVSRAVEKARREVSVERSARFIELVLQDVMEDESLWLGHIIAGVNRMSGYSWKGYGIRSDRN